MKRVCGANLFFLVLLVLQVLSIAFLGPIINASHIPVFMSVPLIELLLIFLPAILYIVVTKQSLREVLSLRTISFESTVIALLIGLLIYPVASFIGLISQFFFYNYLADTFEVFSNFPLWQGILMIAVIPAICEETAMRGAVLNGYKNTSIRKAVLMNGLLFGVLHMNLQQFFYAFAIGVIFAYMVIVTRSIFSSMLCHFACNGISYTVSYYASKSITAAGDLSSLSTSTKVIASVALLAVSVICCVLIIFLTKALKIINSNKREERHENISDSINGSIAVTSLTLSENAEKVINWPFYATIVIYVVFLAVFKIM